ncbi:hypothetical protein [Thioalkalivibrio sulfidiphilus]|uniref:hypothetical protein n=1 Tax=Thioalkalivibrio sulfidiphilus TaxID=1033854 RepID=UPI000360109A|nr:hypothetical protein [Thioalkalivibrio sulfidiphilus]
MTVAVHEAAHLVLALKVDRDSRDTQYVARVSPTGSGAVETWRSGKRVSAAGGMIDHPPVLPDPEFWRPAALNRAAVYMAGLAAEVLFHDCVDEVVGWPHLEDYPDLQNASRFLAFGWPEHHGGPLWLAWRHTLWMLTHDETWDWVMRVASEIDQRGCCDSAMAHHLREARAC